MTSEQVRDPHTDRLLTPQNAVVVIIDYQPVQVASIDSMDRQLLVDNIVGVAKIARAYDVPVVHSTVNVQTGLNKPAIPQLRDVVSDLPTYDRTSINAWEDREFKDAVKATGRNKIVMAALWTEACMAFPTLDALADGFDVYPVADAMGGTSLSAHETALRRVEQAGAQPITWVQLLCELQRDWNRHDTAQRFMELFIETGGTPGLQFANDLDVSSGSNGGSG